MKKTKKIIISVVLLLLVIIIGIFSYYKFFYDKNRLSIKEKEWITENSNKIISFGIPAGINAFSKEGNGIFYDFIKDFEENNTLKINRNTYTTYDGTLGFVIDTNITNEDLLLYKDFYVVISKNDEVITGDFNDKTIGISNKDLELFSKFKGSLKSYDNTDTMFNEFENNTISYLIIPLNEYLDIILNKNYRIIYQFEDISKYYFIRNGSDSTLNSIIKKYYNKWINSNYNEVLSKNYYNLLKLSLEINDIDEQVITNKVYKLGFVSKSPYITLNRKNISGIIGEYFKEFSNLTGAEFEYISYKNQSDLLKAFNNGKIDIMFNDTSNRDNIIKSNINNKFYIVSNYSTKEFYNNLKSINRKICVIKDSSLAAYLKDNGNDLELVKNENKLLNCIKDNKLAAIDSNTYEYFINNKINNTYITYTGFDNININFKYKENDAFSKMFDSIINIYGNKSMTIKGIESYKSADNIGLIIGKIAKYVLIVAGVGILVAGLIVNRKKRVKLNTKIRKDEKLKFVDVMTSLKNRNYLNERMELWNQNTIYPQAIIVIDLNNVKYLNDTFGHEEGDKQIMAAANILHQNQLDNTEIMRTDGNEFMIYMVGYSEKQVINYIKKLVKEFNKLPNDYGAAIGFSMIVDDLKLIDDAINEATVLMRENKEIEYNEIEKEDK